MTLGRLPPEFVKQPFHLLPGVAPLASEGLQQRQASFSGPSSYRVGRDTEKGRYFTTSEIFLAHRRHTFSYLKRGNLRGYRTRRT